MALHAFLLMLHYRANSNVANVEAHAMPNTDLANGCVTHALMPCPKKAL